MDKLFRFLASPGGRATRGVAGAGLIVVGLLWIRRVAGAIVAIVGLVPLAAGLFDFCVFAPLASLPFDGMQLREKLEGKTEA